MTDKYFNEVINKKLNGKAIWSAAELFLPMKIKNTTNWVENF